MLTYRIFSVYAIFLLDFFLTVLFTSDSFTIQYILTKSIFHQCFLRGSCFVFVHPCSFLFCLSSSYIFSVQYYQCFWSLILPMFLKSNITRGSDGSMSEGVGLPNNSYNPITNTAWVRARLCKLQKRCTRLAAASDKVYQLLAHGRWFSPGTPAPSTTKTGCYDIVEILLKVALNTINQIKSINQCYQCFWIVHSILPLRFSLTLSWTILELILNTKLLKNVDPK